MSKYNYHISKELNNLIIRESENLPIQRYDSIKKDWITDWDILAIYTVSIMAIPISKEEVSKLLKIGIDLL